LKVTNDSGCNIRKSTLRSLKDKELPKIFFSLVDYRNNYFLSSDPKDIIHFYEGFESRDELIEWMKERPKGSCEIKEVEGKKDIIVIIPTADFEGEYAKRCREEIFKGLHIIFVVSGKGNNYFNYAHNCNVGINKAMEYNPKWVVLSNDDMYRVDDVSRLRESLSSINYLETDVVFVEPSYYYHCYKTKIGNPTLIRTIFYYLYNRHSRKRIELERQNKKKFNIKYYMTGFNFPYMLFVTEKYRLTNIGDFIIFSGNSIKKNNFYLYDENYINGTEDLDLSLYLKISNSRVNTIRFKIGSSFGGTIGSRASNRSLRELLNLVYFNLKWEKFLNEIKH